MSDCHTKLDPVLQDGIHVAEGASVPALGLSNKAVYQDKSADTALYSDREMTPVANNQYSESAFRPLELTGKSRQAVYVCGRCYNHVL